jgi:hypothetical protein
MKVTERRTSSAGNTLVLTLVILAIVGGLVSLALEYTNSIGRNVQRSLLLRQAIDIGDASTEMAFSAWRAICRTNQTRIFRRSDFDTAIPTPTPGDFPGVANYNLSNYGVYPADTNWNARSSGSSTPVPVAGPYHGDLSYYYVAKADVSIPTITTKNINDPNDPNSIRVKVRRIFQKEQLSLWRYAIFFDDDLEIHPGPVMNVTGGVHTNGNLFTGHNTLTLSGKTTYSDSWNIGFMPGDNTHPETPSSPNWTAGLPPAADAEQQPYGVQLDDYHQLIDYTTSPTDLDPYRFQTQAGLIVAIDASNNVKVYNKSGANITTTVQGAAVSGAITTNDTIIDNREGNTTGNGTVRVTTLDVGILTANVNANTFGGLWNGMIYLIDTSADPNGVTAKRAIRLKNGGSLPDGGLTVASGNPVYVQGDYNTGTTSTIQPASNNATSPDPTSPTVPGYTRQPAAIIADAVTILSNAWLDLKSGSVPTASPTTVNAGLISGIVPTGDGYYSGGVENFPRFLENWSGKSFTYYGSMIELYKSQQAIGRWGSANVYSPPNRAWYFDTSFVSNPPPGLLASFNYRRSRWYLE